MKRYPDEFPAARWPFTLISPSTQLAGGPDPSRGLWVCTACGHNVE